VCESTDVFFLDSILAFQVSLLSPCRLRCNSFIIFLFVFEDSGSYSLRVKDDKENKKERRALAGEERERERERERASERAAGRPLVV